HHQGDRPMSTNTLLPLTYFTEWLASGERGLSSEAIVERLTGKRVTRYPSLRMGYPHDPSDLRRCMELLDAYPLARLAFPSMAEVSPVWAALVAVWDELEATLREEMAGGGRKA